LKWYDLLKNMKETELQYLRFPFVEQNEWMENKVWASCSNRLFLWK
jgi:hypothetical protein